MAIRRSKCGLLDYCSYKGVNIEIRPNKIGMIGVQEVVYFNSLVVDPTENRPLVQACYMWAKLGCYGGLDLKDYLIKMFGP
jgi:hypothetical protein